MKYLVLTGDYTANIVVIVGGRVEEELVLF